MNFSKSLHELLSVIFSTVLMDYFSITGWQEHELKIEIGLDKKEFM